MARAKRFSQRPLVLYLLVLALTAAGVSVLGLISGRAGMTLIGVPLAVLFGWGTWTLSERRLRSYTPGKLAHAQDRLFATRLMRRVLPPPGSDEGDSRKS